LDIKGKKQKNLKFKLKMRFLSNFSPDHPVVSGDTTPTVKGQVHTVLTLWQKAY